MGGPPGAEEIPLLDRSLPATPASSDAAVFPSRRASVVDEAEVGLLANDFNDTKLGKEVDEEAALPPLPLRIPGRRTSLRWLLILATLAITSLVVLLIVLLPAVQSAWQLLNPWAVAPKPPFERFYDPPPQPLDPKGIWVQEAADGDDYAVTAIVVHGLGDQGDGVPFVWDMPLDFPYVRWVAPTADYLNVTVRDHQQTRAWFDMHSFPDVYHNEDVEGYVRSQQQLNQLIDDERARMIELGKEPRIIVMGFSQGGAMALMLSLTAPPGRIEAAVVLSAYLPMMSDAQEWVNRDSRKTPILWLHGKDDIYLTQRNAVRGVATLLKPPISHTALQYRKIPNLGHTYTDDELFEASDWLKQYLGREKGKLDPIDTVGDRLGRLGVEEDADEVSGANETKETASQDSTKEDETVEPKKDEKPEDNVEAATSDSDRKESQEAIPSEGEQMETDNETKEKVEEEEPAPDADRKEEPKSGSESRVDDEPKEGAKASHEADDEAKADPAPEDDAPPSRDDEATSEEPTTTPDEGAASEDNASTGEDNPAAQGGEESARQEDNEDPPRRDESDSTKDAEGGSEVRRNRRFNRRRRVRTA